MQIRGFAILAVFSSVALAQPVLITAPQTLSPGATAIVPTAGGTPVALATADITVRGTTLTVNGRHTVRNLVLEGNATVTHGSLFSYDYSGGAGTDVVNGMELTIAANPTGGNLAVQVGSWINATGRGYASGNGPGRPINNSSHYGAGASHAGFGGQSGPNFAGPGGLVIYGDAARPTAMGSGSWGNGTVAGGGSGGGVIHLRVGGVLQIAGQVVADGTNGGTGGGGGSGGSVWIEAASVTGAGLISANGGSAGPAAGTGSGGGGSGGRIALYACDNQLHAASISALGGTGYRNGGSGTVHVDPDGMFINEQPSSASPCPWSTVTLEFDVRGATSFEWKRNGVAIVDGTSPSGSLIAGSGTSVLRITGILAGDEGNYSCVATNDCASIESVPATISVCPADHNCDGGVDGTDVSAFFNDWELGESAADVNQDGGVDGSDADFFFARWEGGC